MSNVKISQLPTVTNADVGANSLIPLTDSANDTTEAIELSQLDLRWAPVSLETTVSNNQPMTTLGDLIVGGSSGTPTRLPGNTTTTPQVLTQTGTGSASAEPVWTTPSPGTTVAVEGQSALSGAVTFSAGTNITLTQSGQNIEVEAGASTTIAVSGDSPLSGAVVLEPGTNVNLSQSGQDITIGLDTIPVNGGGTGQTSANAGFNALSPMTTEGDLIYGGTSGEGTRLAGPTAATQYILTSTGTGSVAQAPAWAAGGQAIAPTVTTLLSGTGTYTPPVGVSYLIVTASGGGSGGSGGGPSPAAGTAGTNTTFGPITAGGGAAPVNSSAGGVGGTVSVTTSSTVISLLALQGGYGAPAPANATSSSGGQGGSNALGGGGGGSFAFPAANALAGIANTGAGGGGGGAGSGTSSGSSGGGAGGYAKVLFTSPSPSGYSYSVGPGGTGGAGSQTTGGDGGSGVIIIEEYYSPVVLGGSGGAVTPTVQTFLTAGSSGTYHTPSGVVSIQVQMIGGGGGGAGSGSSGGTAAGAGGNTTFGTSLLTANGGSGAVFGTAGGPSGGTASLGTGPIGVAIPGGDGAAGSVSIAEGPGGFGASTPFGGGGSGGDNGTAGASGVGYGSGGGGGGGASGIGGQPSGAAGGFVNAIINAPTSSYAYQVGSSGTAGGAGSSGHAGGAGAGGCIIVTEYYANGAIGTATTITGNVNGSQVTGPLQSSIVEGTTAGGNATAGYIGEYISANSSGVNPVTTSLFVTIASISLTAGDWDVEGQAEMSLGSSTAATGYSVAISLDATSIDTSANGGTNQAFYTMTANEVYQFQTGKRRINVSSTTTVYLVGALTFSALGGAEWQIASLIQARRVR